MDERRERARKLLLDGLLLGDWGSAMDDSVDDAIRESLLRFVRLLETADLDGLVEMAAPDLEVRQPPELPGARTYRGGDGLIETFVDWPSQWEETRIEPVRTWQVGPGVTITQTHQYLRGAGSGLELEADFWMVVVWRDGKLARWTMHTSEADAETAAKAQA